MTRIQVSTALFGAVLGIVAVAPKAAADEWDKKTIVTIAEPMEVPGVVLLPGTYVFKLADSASDRHIVVIQNERQDKTFATILAIPNYRLQPAGKTRLQFWETPAGQPKALRAWFYPADNFGQEFAYSKTRATEISQIVHQEVPSDAAPLPTSSAAPQEPVVIAENTPPPAPEPASAPVIAAAPAPAPEPALLVAENNAPSELPQTAGNLPLLALLGSLLVGFALALGALAKRAG